MAVSLHEDEYIDLIKKEHAIESMKRVLEISSCIDTDDFYICTGEIPHKRTELNAEQV